jgi:hypothetical protein
MSDLKDGRIVFNEGVVYAGEGKMSPNPLEYAPKGTLKELAALRSLLRDATEVVRAYHEAIPTPESAALLARLEAEEETRSRKAERSA